jgi:hypothetical protein
MYFINSGVNMIRLLCVVAAIAIPFASASAAKPCAELKSEIAARIDAKGIKDYALEIVANEQSGNGKVVGSCDGGTKKIVYSKGEAAQKPQSDASK